MSRSASAATANLAYVLGSLHVSDAYGNRLTYDGYSIERVIAGAGDDTVIVNEVGSGGMTLDGWQGADTYVVNFGELEGTVTLTDSGTGGVDRITMNGTAGNDVHKQGQRACPAA